MSEEVGAKNLEQVHSTDILEQRSKTMTYPQDRVQLQTHWTVLEREREGEGAFILSFIFQDKMEKHVMLLIQLQEKTQNANHVKYNIGLNPSRY